MRIALKTALFTISVLFQILVYVKAWGLHVHSWPWLIFGGIYAPMFFNFLNGVIDGKDRKQSKAIQPAASTSGRSGESGTTCPRQNGMGSTGSKQSQSPTQGDVCDSAQDIQGGARSGEGSEGWTAGKRSNRFE